MKFKRIYIEITNVCNLNCSFCTPHHRQNKFMTIEEFEKILKKIHGYTKHIYLHVKGEPLLHPKIDDIIELAYKNGFKINLTTNATLLNEHLKMQKYLRQINISLHSTNDINIVKMAKNIKDCIVCIRVWNIDENLEIIKALEEELNIKIPNTQNVKLSKNIFLSQQNKFIWPTLTENCEDTNGYCYGLKNQIAILVDGTVTPCCLDNEGDLNLGNIFIDELEKILNSDRANKIRDGFRNRIANEPLCKKCTYKLRF